MNTTHLFYRVLFVLVALLSPFASASAVAANERSVMVKWVPDGDTMRLRSGRWVRLQGIDAPEMGRDGQPGQYFSEEATAALQGLVMGQPLTLVSHGKDRYGRTLATCLLADGRDVAAAMVQDGFAFYYPHREHTQVLRHRLLTAQRTAMQKGRGFWPRIKILSDNHGAWMGNSRSGRAFPVGTAAANSIHPTNQVPLPDLWEVYWQGYSPARSVSCWPAASHYSAPFFTVSVSLPETWNLPFVAGARMRRESAPSLTFLLVA
ncbi:thermonuclease family protein [Desulfovibrio ferrophilus]|uniref:thermonuclease family protein n=1 Tax=Desulfovibrio ferrophilus TaxID=241368 RepID=UPI000F818919